MRSLEKIIGVAAPAAFLMASCTPSEEERNLEILNRQIPADSICIGDIEHTITAERGAFTQIVTMEGYGVNSGERSAGANRVNTIINAGERALVCVTVEGLDPNTEPTEEFYRLHADYGRPKVYSESEMPARPLDAIIMNIIVVKRDE